MKLENGSKIGPYEILSPLGAGGMGEVYRARDVRLDRTVAIKILGSSLSDDDTVRARFEREARAISALSHANICSLYDIGNDAGVEYLVMECLEGEMLSARIARGPLPLSQVLRYGEQIAEALHHAHRTHITHRDLKPGNIMITASGAKLLDFGLAKLIEPTPLGLSESAAQTHRVNPLTTEGTVVGTIHYMSPEQLEGKRTDHRTDIFSLGVILFEMVTGQRPFQGASATSVMVAILSSDPPPLRSLQPSAPPALERIIVTALEKDSDERWQTAHDVARQLRWMNDSSQSGVPAMAAAVARRRLAWPAMLLTAMAATALLTWGGTRLLSRAPARPDALWLQFAPPADLQILSLNDTNVFALSPDGRTLCFLAANGSSRALYLRSLDSLEVRRVEGSDDATGPFWSSDAEWIAFSAGGKLWKTKAVGGAPPETICDVSAAGAVGSWRGETILFADRPGGRQQILSVPSQGGSPVMVTTVKESEWRHTWPYLLADGEHFFYHSWAADSFDRQLVLASLASPEESVLLQNVSQARVVGEDRLVYVRDGKLLAQRFDLAKGSVLGEQVIATDVAYFSVTARAEFDASPGGVIVFRTNTGTGRLVLLDRGGRETRLIDDRGPFVGHNVSADGSKAAVTVVTRATGLMDIWIYDLTRAVRDRFTSEPGIEFAPVWSPDGSSIVYSESKGGVLPHIVRRSLTASTSDDLVPPGLIQYAGSFSADGLQLFYEQRDPRTRNDILGIDLKTKVSEPLLGSNVGEGDPAASPDGRWIAFTSDATGNPEVYIRSLLGGEAVPIRISSEGGRVPRWRDDSQELFYLAPNGIVVSAVPRASGLWESVFESELFRVSTKISGFAALPDGQSFLISDETPGATDSMYQVILGWQ